MAARVIPLAVIRRPNPEVPPAIVTVEYPDGQGGTATRSYCSNTWATYMMTRTRRNRRAV